MRRAWLSSFVAVAVTLARTASADPSVRLVYVRGPGAESCPDETVVRRAVATRLGYDPFSPDANTTLFADVAKVRGVYRARVRLVDASDVVHGARELERPGAACADLVDAMALGMSIVIDPRALTGPRPPEPAPEPAPEPEPEPTPERETPTPPPPEGTPPAPRTTTTSPARVVPIIGVAVTGLVGAAPSATGGLLLFGGVHVGPFALYLEGRADLPASRDVGAGKVTTAIVAGSVVPCIGAGLFLGCGVLTVGRLAAKGEGFAKPDEDAAVHVLAGARAGVVVPVSARFDLRLLGDVGLAITHSTLRIDGRGVYEMPLVAAGLVAGMGVRFP